MKLKFNYIIISAFVLTSLVMGSCKKLSIDPITSYSEANFWKHPNHASAALNGAYSLLQQTLNTEFAYYGEARADLLELHVENNIQSINVINNRLDVNMGFADWANFYRVVQQCNLILKYVPSMVEKNILTDNAEYNRIMGQAHALRALCYFYMVRIWGEVPIITQATEVVEDINSLKTPRSPMIDIDTLIVKDLTEARTLLNSYTTYDAKLTRTHITRGAVDAIFTDFYLWIGDVENAIIHADKLVKDDGEPVSTSTYGYAALTGTTASARYTSEYARMFYEGYSKESIFEIAFNMDENSTSGLWGVYGGSGQAQFQASPKALSLLGSSDPRRDVVFNTGSTKRFVQKFFEKVDFDRTTMNDKNVIIYRLADITLLKAEALIKRNNSGDRDIAFALINKIKTRAGVGLLVKSEYDLQTNADIIDEILLERAKELCFEGKRWFDLVRNNKATEVMPPERSDPRSILWPINLGIIRQNPNIVQNEYYK